MTSKVLSRSSILLILSGVLLGGAMLFHPDVSRPDFAASPAWVPVHIVLGLSALFGLVGLAGLFSLMSLILPAFGKAVFGLAMLGNLLLTGIMLFVEASVLPVLARDPVYQELLYRNGPLFSGLLGAGVSISFIVATIGLLALAGFLAARKTISFANALLFVGAPLLFLSPPLPFVYGLIGGLLLSVGVTWLGLSVRRGIAHHTIVVDLQLQDECLAHLGHA